MPSPPAWRQVRSLLHSPFLGLHVADRCRRLAWLLARQYDRCQPSATAAVGNPLTYPADLGARPMLLVPTCCCMGRTGSSGAQCKYRPAMLRHMHFAALVASPAGADDWSACVPLGHRLGPAHFSTSPFAPPCDRLFTTQCQAGAQGRRRADSDVMTAATGDARKSDHRHRQRPDRHQAHRAVAGTLRRALHRAPLHRRRAGHVGAPRSSAPPPMPSASPPRRPAPRRWAPACRRACSGATWAS